MAININIWSKNELEILSNNAQLEIRELVKLLPERSLDSVRSKRNRLLGKKSNDRNRKRPSLKQKNSPTIPDLKIDIKNTDFEDEIEKLEIVHKERLKTAKDNHFNEVRELERNHETVTTELKKQHKLEINNLERRYFSKLDSLETTNRSKYKELTNKYNTKLIDLNRYHENLISSIKEKYNIPENNSDIPNEVPVDKKKESNITKYHEAVNEFNEISKIINQPILLDDKRLIIGEVIYLAALEKDINVRKNIKNGIIKAIMTKSSKYWSDGNNLKLEQWLDRLKTLGESVNFENNLAA